MKELTEQSTNLFVRKERLGMRGFAVARTQKTPILEKPLPTITPDENSLEKMNDDHQIGVATELAKGRVVRPCITAKSVCPLLTLDNGCSKPLVMQEGSVSCPEGKGRLAIQSERIMELKMQLI